MEVALQEAEGTSCQFSWAWFRSPRNIPAANFYGSEWVIKWAQRHDCAWGSSMHRWKNCWLTSTAPLRKTQVLLLWEGQLKKKKDHFSPCWSVLAPLMLTTCLYHIPVPVRLALGSQALLLEGTSSICLQLGLSTQRTILELWQLFFSAIQADIWYIQGYKRQLFVNVIKF